LEAELLALSIRHPPEAPLAPHHRMSRRTLLALASFLPVLLPAAARGQAPPERLTLAGELLPGATSVTKTGSVWTLAYAGDELIRYQIDTADPEVRKGVLVVREATSDSYPIHMGGPFWRDSSGVQWPPQIYGNTTTVSAEYAAGNSLVLEYTDKPAGGGTRHRRHTFTIAGKALRIRVQDLDQSLSYTNNYSGVYTGPTRSTESPQLVQMQGSLSVPIVLFRNGSASYLMGNVLDMYQSNASDWSLNQASTVVPGPDKIEFSMHTLGRYFKDSTGKLSAPVDDTWTVIVSSHLADVFVKPTQAPSPWLEGLRGRTVALLASNSGWDAYEQHFGQYQAWGMDEIAAYYFYFWTSQGGGPAWYPAKEPVKFKSMMSAGVGSGMQLGAYVQFAQMPPGATPPSVYDPLHIARTETGAFKLSLQNGAPLIATTASAIHADREMTLIKQDYGANLAYLDIQTYASPSRGADGDHVDQRASSPWARTLGKAIADQKAWMRGVQALVEGPLLGEGSIATQGSNLEWLWGGYCDSVQRVINTGAGKHANKIPAGDPKAITRWPVIPEFEWRVMNGLQANHGNGIYDRFFGPSDGPTMVDSNGNPKFPLTEAALDRYRIYEITYGHASFFMSNGPQAGSVSNMLELADMAKEYYLVNELQRRFYAVPVRAINYMHQGALKPFERVLYQTKTTDSFRDPRMQIVFQGGLVIYLNHSTSAWSVPGPAGSYTLPEDGWLAYAPDGFVAFSGIAPGSGGSRIDYCYAPARWEMLDGRGAVSSFGGINTGSVKRFKAQNFVHNRSVQESSNGTLTTTQGVAPAVVKVELVGGPLVTSRGERKPLRAIASFANGAWRDVTMLVQWSTDDLTVASADQAGVVLGSVKGQTLVRVSAFQGVTAAPVAVTVP
jgi:hypothetical protein